MSVFSKTIDYLSGVLKLRRELEELKQNVSTPVVESKCKCKNRLVYDVNSGYVTVIDCDGSSYNGYVDKEVAEKLKTADTAEIIRFLSYKEEKVEENKVEQEEKEIVSNFLDVFEGVDDFEVRGNSVYFKGITSVEIPSLIVGRFVDLIQKLTEFRLWETFEEKKDLESLEQEYKSLKSFTLKLLLNPLKSSREQLLTFVRNNRISTTINGNLVLYRACYEGKENNENTALVKFVAKEYLKLKAWKKSPKNYWVWGCDDGTFELVKENLKNTGVESNLGNLAELYTKLPEMQSKGKQYYSSHGKKKMIIGDIYKIEDEEVDLNADVCHAGGLHAASVDYDYSSYGDVNLVVLINPAKTITVPTYDIGKMRVSEMMIVGINPNPQGVPISEDFYCDLDDNYHNYSIEELENALQTKSLGVTSVSDAISEVSLKEVQNITNLLKNRVINL